ncbi:hypothetical protein PUN28_007746 [Cardiocondyla obscurior]|uniref:Uncharacterized protein n=1 Tax=Cardiocondyla obscurior TaxID=286306 RepID=A0AAW2FW03_9HYME
MTLLLFQVLNVLCRFPCCQIRDLFCNRKQNSNRRLILLRLFSNDIKLFFMT